MQEPRRKMKTSILSTSKELILNVIQTMLYIKTSDSVELKKNKFRAFVELKKFRGRQQGQKMPLSLMGKLSDPSI